MKKDKRNKLDIAISILNCDMIIEKTQYEDEKLWATYFKLKFENELRNKSKDKEVN